MKQMKTRKQKGNKEILIPSFNRLYPQTTSQGDYGTSQKKKKRDYLKRGITFRRSFVRDINPEFLVVEIKTRHSNPIFDLNSGLQGHFLQK